ncbi:hypothetical protein [Paenibacillus sp. P13VS]|uniref:hypothetical protein n=1 Tax=Paenibacillus sp. P13VS TaxID=2697367 RepID=UPI00187BA2CB|nr:hypothetical protein [Paenibacillus sp. P13VS]MBE7681488.1 hypothetical protein [Paenibacillus sp. P13VS]
MQNIVITYTDPARLSETAPFAPYVNSLHLCATNSLREGMVKYYQQKHSEFIHAPIVSAGMLFSKLLGSWSSPAVKMKQFTKLTKLMRGQENVWGRELCRAFRHNQIDVLQTMRTLAEIGVTPGKFKPASREEQLFQSAWSRMEARESSFQRIRSKLDSAFRMEQRLREALEHCLIDMNRLPERITEIVLHGFYFITPLQYRVMSLFREAGIRLVFLNLYDKRYPNTFRSVERFLSQWVPFEQWKMVQSSAYSEASWGDVFALSYEDEIHKLLDAQSGPQVIQFEDFQTFLSHYEGYSKTETCYSPGHENLNKRLKDYYPENYPDRHFLAYPIGQYLFHLHQMWDDQKGELALSEKGLFECFSSGWLQIEEHNARNFTGVLEDVLPYFASCNTLKEWRRQAALLKEVKMNAADAFEHSSNRFHRMMENPMLRFSFLQIKHTDIVLLVQFMEKLFTQAELLFGQKEIQLHEHFERIEQLLAAGPDPESLVEEERKLLEQLRGRLKLDFIDDESYYIDDVAQAVALYLGGEFNDELEEPPLPISKFEDVDAAAFMDSEIHLCTLDEESLPYVGQAMPWPLTRQTVRGLQSPELDMLFIREDVSSASARYLFYNVLTFAKQPVRLSWIRNTEGRKLEESVYIMVLGLAAEKRSTLFQPQDLEPAGCTEGDREAVFHHLESFPADAAAEYALCPRRFYYSFVVKPFASYRNEFHQQILYQNLLKASYVLSDASTAEIDAQLSAIFPHWPEVRKRYLAEEAQKYRNTFSRRYDPYEGRDYVRGRRLFQLLLSGYTVDDENLMEPVNKVFQTNNTDETLVKPIQHEELLQLRANPSELCRFCPHLPVCVEGYYPTDDKMRSYK